MIRSLRVARATAMKARTQAINALKALVVTAPDELREQLRALSAVRLVQTTAELEPGPVTTPAAAARLGLRTLARRYQVLSAELAMLDTELDRLTATAAPRLVALLGSGRTRPGRFWSPPATTLIGCAPTPASECCAGPHRSRPPRARPNGTG
jgi:hypothetical protein